MGTGVGDGLERLQVPFSAHHEMIHLHWNFYPWLIIVRPNWAMKAQTLAWVMGERREEHGSKKREA